MGVSVGVDETKEDKRDRLPRVREIKRVRESAEEDKSKNLLQQNVRRGAKSTSEPCCFPASCKSTGTGKRSASAGVISVTDKELYAQRGVRRRAGLHRERGTRLHNWPRNCQQLAWSELAALKPLWSRSRFHVSISKYIRAERRTESP